MRTTHRTEMCDLGRVLGQGLVVVLAGLFGIQTQVELVFPAEFETRLGEGVVTNLGTGMPLGEVCSMCSYLVGDNAFTDILLIWKPQVLLGCYVAEHRCAIPADIGRTNSRGNVVITGSDISNQWAQGIERRLVTITQLLVDIFLHHLQWHMARALNHHLYIMFPGDFCELTQGFQFAELGCIISIRQGTGAQAIA